MIESGKNGKRDRNSSGQCIRALQSDKDASPGSGGREAVPLCSYTKHRLRGWPGGIRKERQVGEESRKEERKGEGDRKKTS